MAHLEVFDLCKGWDHVVLDRLDLTVEKGEFFVIVGPSGIGKTTLLRLIAGLEHPDRGTVTIAGRDQTKIPPYRRNVALTFESYALYPHLSVFENIASPLRARRENAAEIETKVKEVAKLLRIDQLLDRKPGEISGGQKQRTALGRTLVRRPDVFLLDEPISHLDAKIRHELRLQFHHLEELRRTATVYVTHDYAEALSLGDRIGVLGDGRLRQIGTPRQVFGQPADIFVARHLGQPSINEVPADLIRRGDRLYVAPKGEDMVLAVGAEQSAALSDSFEGADVTLGLRPQHLRVGPPGTPLPPAFQAMTGTVDVYEALGTHGVLMARIGDRSLTALTDLDHAFEPGEPVQLGVDPAHLLYFCPTRGHNLLV